MLVTTHQGNNAVLIKEVADFYIKDGDDVADVTYGRGTFWKLVDTKRFGKFLISDIATTRRKYDFRELPYEDDMLDHFIFDPPYMHSPGKTSQYNSLYRTSSSHGADGIHGKQRTLYHNEIMEDYKAGMEEAYRTLRTDGLLWVKCKDEIESGYQRWSHIEIYDGAREIGFIGKDLFILITNSTGMPARHGTQLHARKKHSYLWIFRKPSEKEYKKFEKYQIL